VQRAADIVINSGDMPGILNKHGGLFARIHPDY
jgi:hypothetical protein